jgi:hypothetical protein
MRQGRVETLMVCSGSSMVVSAVIWTAVMGIH